MTKRWKNGVWKNKRKSSGKNPGQSCGWFQLIPGLVPCGPLKEFNFSGTGPSNWLLANGILIRNTPLVPSGTVAEFQWLCIHWLLFDCIYIDLCWVPTEIIVKSSIYASKVYTNFENTNNLHHMYTKPLKILKNNMTYYKNHWTYYKILKILDFWIMAWTALTRVPGPSYLVSLICL